MRFAFPPRPAGTPPKEGKRLLKEIMPVPKTREELLVHLCDYIASRNFLNVAFKDNEIVDSVDRPKKLTLKRNKKQD